MSIEYDKYLEQHLHGVNKACVFLADNFEDYKDTDSDIYDLVKMNKNRWSKLGKLIKKHDKSKTSLDEYPQYDRYFFEKDKGSEEKIKKDFQYAWNHHIHNNPHHWQYWCVVDYKNDEFGKPIVDVECLDIPLVYILEMVCDWWSFGLRNDEPEELFRFYESRKNRMWLSDKTREKLERILDILREILEKKTVEK